MGRQSALDEQLVRADRLQVSTTKLFKTLTHNVHTPATGTGSSRC